MNCYPLIIDDSYLGYMYNVLCGGDSDEKEIHRHPISTVDTYSF